MCRFSGEDFADAVDVGGGALAEIASPPPEIATQRTGRLSRGLAPRARAADERIAGRFCFPGVDQDELGLPGRGGPRR